MKALTFFSILAFLLASCSGPVFVAKNEQEGIRASYQDPRLAELSTRNRATLSDIYRRYQLANVDIYPNGIGFTALSDSEGIKHYYLLVDVRPRDITFGWGVTKPAERFSEVFNRDLQKNLRLMRAEDLRKTGVDGLAFGVHWPVRDLSQCDKYGGFLEYVMLYIPKTDFDSFMNGESTFAEMTNKAEIFVSQERKGPEAIKVVQED
jgi:hypothetical protein